MTLQELKDKIKLIHEQIAIVKKAKEIDCSLSKMPFDFSETTNGHVPVMLVDTWIDCPVHIAKQLAKIHLKDSEGKLQQMAVEIGVEDIESLTKMEE